MSEKTLIERGAECVAGDLILNRKVVGRYRNGQFILTPEGVEEIENVVVAGAPAAAAAPAQTRAARGARTPKGQAPVQDVTDITPKTDTTVDDLVGGLDAALGA